MHGLLVHLWSKVTFERIGERCGGLLEVVNAQHESWEWVELKVCRPDLAPKAVWLFDDIVGYHVAVWKKKPTVVYSMAEFMRIIGEHNLGDDKLELR